MELNAADIIPSEFAANQSWRHYLIHCDFQPNDEAQYIGIEDFQTAITDLSIDYVRVEGLPDAPYISSNLLMDGAIRSRHIAHNAVGAAQVADSSIGTSHLAANAVTTAKIATGAVNTTELANNAVTNAKISNNTITHAKIKDPVALYQRTNQNCTDNQPLISTSPTCLMDICSSNISGVAFYTCDGSCGPRYMPPRLVHCPNTLIGYLVAP